jgi:hypothetical protein
MREISVVAAVVAEPVVVVVALPESAPMAAVVRVRPE